MRNPAFTAFILLLVVTGLTAGLLATRTSSHAVGSVSSVHVDTNVSGNTATSVGSIESCGTIASTGQTIVIDVVVFSNVAVNNPGIGGFNFTLGHDSNVVQVTAVNNMMLLSSASGTVPIDLSETPPNSAPNMDPDEFIVGFADFGPNSEGGNGVLSRITLQAVGTGVSPLNLTGTTVSGGSGEDLHAGNFFVVNGTVVVGGVCGGPTPTPAPSQSPTPAPSAPPSVTSSPAPTGGTSTPTQPPAPTATPTAAPTDTPVPSPTAPGQTPGPTPSPTPFGQTPTATPPPTPSPTPGPTLTPAPSEPVTMKGDADCSTDVTTSDAIVILLSLGAGEPIPCPSAADVTCDGHITTDDLQAILKWRGGLPVSLPGGCPAIATS